MKTTARSLLFAVLLFACTMPALAQPKDSEFRGRIESARKLYINGSYFAAEKAFMELGESLGNEDDFVKTEVEAYKVLCAIALDKVNVVGMVKVFCDKYPNSPQQGMVKYALGSRLFDTGKYKEALDVFNTIKRGHVYRPQRNDYEFRKAYCNMRVGNFDEAGEGYQRILDGSYSRYTVPSTYYRGYVYYSLKQFEKAVPLFEQVVDDSRFELMSRYYAVESMFMLKDYDYVIKNGTKLFPSLENDLKVSLARILSESFYIGRQNEQAQYYLDYYRNSGADLSRKDYYFAGILSYNMGRYDSALESFSKVMGEEDELSQNACYYTAHSYLQNRNKVEALNSFRKAADMDFDNVIKEDAWFNFAKLSFDVNSDISQFDEYIKTFPKSGKEDIINNYVAASFLRSKNYRAAVDALSKIKKHTNESSGNLQKAAFFSAMQLVDNKGYRAALDYLKIAADNAGSNQPMNNLVRYWLSECCYRGDDFETAIALNNSLIADEDFHRSPEYPMTLYNQGYACLKSKDYESAKHFFSEYIAAGSFSKRQYEHDARVRLADSYFLLEDYASAAPMYEEIYAKDYLTNDAYPALQAARAHGLTGDLQKKISILKLVTRNNRTSPLYPQAMYELGCAYVQNGSSDEASGCFFTILGMENDSTFYAKSLLELASICVTTRKYDRAIEYYKTIVSETPYAPEAQDAIQGLESVYGTLNRPEEFLAYIDNMGMSDLKTESEKESMLFKSAERSYQNHRYSSALSSLQRFLSQYPDGSLSRQATFLMADCLEQTGRLETASDIYRKLMQSGSDRYGRAATSNYARIAYSLGKYQDAIDSYTALIAVETQSQKTAAYLGRLKALFGAGKYEDAIKDATYLLNASDLPDIAVRETRFRLAKSYLFVGERDYAKPILETLANDLDDEFGAESKYLLIRAAYDRGDFASVENLVYDFASSGTPHQYWVAKSVIVLGDSYLDRDDALQARSIFETLRDGYEPSGDGDDVLEQLRDRLKDVKSTRR
ncbi:MAG: tetratricopeptide repeat protein [Bacteroidales bacterium]|nr:tetratricopeptide repeat protein [Candidatus Cacconaster merdequi]